MKLLRLVVATLCLDALTIAQMPVRSPELQKLDYFAGKWKTTGQTNASPMGPGGPVTGTDAVEWQKGKFFEVWHSEYTTPVGQATQLSIMGYDSKQQVFTYDAFNSDGEHEIATGTTDGQNWLWNSAPSSVFKWRYTQKILSPSSFTSKFEVSLDGAHWATVYDSKSEKQ